MSGHSARHSIQSSLLLSALLLTGGSLRADVPVQTSLTQNDTPYSVVSGDLIENYLAGLNITGNFDREGIMGFFAMLDGVYGPQGDAAGNPGLEAFSAGTGEEVEILLDTFSNPNGYTVNAVNTLAAWSATRASQAYQLEYESTLMPGVWHRVATVLHNPGANPGFNTNTSVSIASSGSGALIENVSALRFVFSDTDAWGWNGYREIDVAGVVAAAPVGPKTIEGIKVGTETFVTSGADLLQTAGFSTSITGTFTQDGIQGVTALYDGVFGGQGPQSGNPPGLGAADGNTGEMITFTFDLTGSPYGYTLTGIDSYAGWDGSHGGQRYNIYYSTVGNPTNFLPLADVDLDANSSNAPGGDIATSAMIRDADGVLAQNVAALRFSFSDVTDGFAAYRELDVFGFATPVPEPGAAGLALLSGLLAARRRR